MEYSTFTLYGEMEFLGGQKILSFTFMGAIFYKHFPGANVPSQTFLGRPLKLSPFCMYAVRHFQEDHGFKVLLLVGGS